MKRAVIYIPEVILPEYYRQTIIDSIKTIKDSLYKDYDYDVIVIDDEKTIKDAIEKANNPDMFITLSPYNGTGDIVSKDSDGAIFAENGNENSLRLANIINTNTLFKLPIQYQSTIYTKSENKKAMIRIVHVANKLYVPGILASINLYFNQPKKKEGYGDKLYRVIKQDGGVIASGVSISSMRFQCDMNINSIIVNDKNEIIYRSRSGVVQSARLVTDNIDLVKNKYKKIYK